jgi:hypothetical protein
LSDLLEKSLFLRVGVGVADGGDLLGRNACSDELLDDLLIG